MTSDLAGEQIGGWRQYTHSVTTAAWLSQHFYLHWKYSADRSFLEQRAYPICAIPPPSSRPYRRRKALDGFRTIPLSASPEINDNRPSAWFDTVTNYDLSLMRWLLAASAELAAELKLDAEAARWRRVLAEMPPFSYGDDGRLLVAKGYPLPASHRHFSHLMAIHPLGLIDLSDGRRSAAHHSRHRSRNSTRKAATTGAATASPGSPTFRRAPAMAPEPRSRSRSSPPPSPCATASTATATNRAKGYSKFKYRPFTLEGQLRRRRRRAGDAAAEPPGSRRDLPRHPRRLEGRRRSPPSEPRARS